MACVCPSVGCPRMVFHPRAFAQVSTLQSGGVAWSFEEGAGVHSVHLFGQDSISVVDNPRAFAQVSSLHLGGVAW